jgi:hypothetical protein
VVEGQTDAGAAAPQPAPKLPTEAGLSSRDVVVVLDEDSVPPLSPGGRDVKMAPVTESVLAAVIADPFPAAEVPETSPAAEVPGSAPTEEVEESS